MYLEQLSGENKTLIDKSMFERLWKYKCCVFIDFEYMYMYMQLIYPAKSILLILYTCLHMIAFLRVEHFSSIIILHFIQWWISQKLTETRFFLSCSIKEWVSFFLGSWGMNCSAGQTNRVNREAVLGRFVCSALQFIPHEPRKKRHSFLIFTMLPTKTLSKIVRERL